ncbi:TolC family protein [Lutibacter sp. A64]|uniref:TolC family protein n=1 Tax=Lutibacter sp. A64 TaxID=2918526 RepID=UPI001F06E763|nr:TolC family protein [Lutibacter sp. A64]UMB54491.1 TolC family protein [Lutibacter sp. A64]
MNYINKIAFAFLLCLTSGFAQEKLTKEDAVNLALENNYGILIAKNNVKIAENNASLNNSGYLPQITASAGANYNLDDTEYTLQNGTVSETNGAESNSYNASIGLNYTLYDGLGRTYNYKKLKEAHNLSELEAQTVIENSLLQVFSIYYNVAQLTEDSKNIKESLSISKQRLLRAKYGFDYGQNTKLEVLNAEVDVNNDSINYINTQRLLANSKRDLNLVLGRNVNTDFTVDTDITFNLVFELNTLIEKAKEYNIEIQKANKNLELSQFDIKINKSNLLPSLSLNSSYGFNKNNNDGTFTYAEQLSKGLNAGLSLNWNIFDGGSTKTSIQNAKIYEDNLKVQKEQTLNELERNVANALEVYNNALFILNAEEKNVETNKNNFSRTEEKFKLGQTTSIEFRQAQLNLLNAQSSYNIAKYDAKNAELILLQLSGELLDTDF